jgi:hypothetical protein
LREKEEKRKGGNEEKGSNKRIVKDEEIHL